MVCSNTYTTKQQSLDLIFFICVILKLTLCIISSSNLLNNMLMIVSSKVIITLELLKIDAFYNCCTVSHFKL